MQMLIPARAPSGIDSFMVQNVHFDINLSNMTQEEVNFLDLSGGHEHTSFKFEC